MEINCLIAVLFATLLVGMECRSVTSSNLNQATGVSESPETSKQFFWPHFIGFKDLNKVINLTNVNRQFIDRIAKDFSVELSRLITTQGPNLENLLTGLIMRTVNATDQEETVAQWLKQLRLTVETLSTDIQIEKSGTSAKDCAQSKPILDDENKNYILIDESNWLDNLREFLDEQHTNAEGNDNENYVKSSLKDSLTDSSYSLVDQRPEPTGYKDRSDRHDSHQLDDINVIRKHFGKLCRKHRAAL